VSPITLAIVAGIIAIGMILRRRRRSDYPPFCV
jgi:hypothetical protein